MEKFIYFWDHISNVQRLVILMGGMLFFWIVETLFPLIHFSYKRYKHAGVNLVFLATSMVLNLILGFFTIKACLWVTEHQFGIFNWIHFPLGIKVFLALFMMDLFGQYLPHYAMHRYKWMWKFHLVHHSDSKVDVTTGTRHHPGEWLFRESSTILGVFVLGLPVGLYFLYRSTAAIFTHFNHANFSLPMALDKAICLVFVSPNMHKAHHHFERPLTDTNFSNIFSVWDRMLGTFAYEDPSKLKYGLDVLDESKDENLKYQMQLPFDKKIKTDY